MLTANDSPRVLFVDQSGALGGAELCLLDNVRRRSGRDGAVLLSPGPFEERLTEAGLEVSVLPLNTAVDKSSGLVVKLRALPAALSTANALARIARNYDVIYANTQKAAVVASVAALRARRPLIWHVHDILDAAHFSASNRRLVVSLTNRTGTCVIANSETTSAAYEAAGGRLPVSVVYNGIDAAPFDGSEHDRNATRVSIGLPRNAYVVGCFGRLAPWKGQHVLLDALEQPDMRNTHAIFVGEALYTDEDREYATSLKKRTRSSSLNGRVHWLGHREDVPGLMKAADVIVHCSTSPEPFGRVIVEGQLAGRPVIAADAGGAAEIISHNQTGVLTTPGNAAELAASISRLMADREEAERLATNGRADAVRRFNIDDRAAEINAVIAEAASRAS